MNGRGKSDSSVVPGKRSNNVGESAAETVEGRGLAKGNSHERNTFRTQSRGDVPSALERVRQAATRNRKQRFTALLHHVYDIECLRKAYLALKRDAVVRQVVIRAPCITTVTSMASLTGHASPPSCIIAR